MSKGNKSLHITINCAILSIFARFRSVKHRRFLYWILLNRNLHGVILLKRLWFHSQLYILEWFFHKKYDGKQTFEQWLLIDTIHEFKCKWRIYWYCRIGEHCQDILRYLLLSQHFQQRQTLERILIVGSIYGVLW